MTPPNTDGVLPMTLGDGSRLTVEAVGHKGSNKMPAFVDINRSVERGPEIGRTLRYVPEDASAGVVVPEGIRRWAQGVSANSIPWQAETIRAANWILSLPAAPQPLERSAAQVLTDEDIAMLRRVHEMLYDMGITAEQARLRERLRKLLERLGGGKEN